MRRLGAGLRGQGGQMIAIVAVVALILIAFTGLVVDGGEVTTEHRDAQNAVDAAALAAAIQIGNNHDETNATALATLVAAKNGIATTDLTVAYLDSGGAPTGTPANVASIKATIAHVFGTIFLPILGIDSATVGATATASVSHGGGCVLCIMNPTASNTLQVGDNAALAVTGGPIAVNSTSATAVTTGSNGSITDDVAINIAGNYQPGGTYTPPPTTGAAPVSDPFAAVPVPTVINHPPCCTSPLNPGVYSTISISNNASLVLNPGVYVVTGGITLSNNSTLTGHNVLIYLACSAYPTPCAPGQAGASFTARNNINVDLSAPSTGTYQGMALFADRNNVCNIAFGNNGQARFLGSLYALGCAFDLSNNSGGNLDNRFVVGSLILDNNGQATIDFKQSTNYVAPNTYLLTN